MADVLLERQNNGEFIKQRTKEWYDIRMKILTASDIASVLDCNIYQSGNELLMNKINAKVFNNISTDWGNKFESIALEIYKNMTNESVSEIGLVLHPVYKWLGASPDGLVKSGKLLEIKCPYKRNIETCPIHYWIQMQIQMEVCNIDECDYFDCKFCEYLEDFTSKLDINYKESQSVYKGICDNPWRLDSYSLKTIARDRDWFENNIEKINNFYDKMKYYQKNDIIVDIKKHKKRKIADISYDMSMFIDWKLWVNAYEIKNFMIDDPINDWLSRITKINDTETKTFLAKLHKNKSIFNEYVNNKNKIFKQNILAYIIKKIQCVEIQETNPKSHKGFMSTLENMKKKVPVIFNAVLHDYKKQIYGVADILIRADCMSELFNMKSSDHYRIVEIKNTTLHLCADNINLRNTKNIYCKGKTYILNKILGEMQGYTPSKSYILGKNIIYKKGNVFTKCDSFERLASVDFNLHDIATRKKTARAIKWIRSLQNCNDWSLFPPTVSELRPNMCNISNFQNIKTDIASRQNEITELWMCGFKNREIALDNNIINWRTHPNIKSEMLGVTGKHAKTLQLILDYNSKMTSTNIIHPKKIKSKLFNWRKSSNIEFFVDFETMPDDANSMIFMAGVGYFINKSFKYKCFIADDISNQSEAKLLDEMNSFIIDTGSVNTRPARIWHWSHAEKTIYNAAINRTGITSKLENWCDLLMIFKEEPIVVRGALNFSLKSIVYAFNTNGFIDISYKDSKVANGLDAMCLAYAEYNEKKNLSESVIIKDIKSYNEIDVSSLYNILFYLRNKH
jgi:putative phage-type endonuclease